MRYLTDIPNEIQEYGFSKVLNVRHEVIHIKHIMTEVFVRKTIPIQEELSVIDYNVMDYMEYLTNRLRRVHHFPRTYKPNDINDVVKSDRDNFFPTIRLVEGHDVIIVLDFDGVITEKRFKELYELCCKRGKVHICTANPTVSEEWFIKRGYTIPHKIHSMRGAEKKIKRIIELQKTHDYVFYVDNETRYLKKAWLFGVQTYHYTNGKITYYSRKTK